MSNWMVADDNDNFPQEWNYTFSVELSDAIHSFYSFGKMKYTVECIHLQFDCVFSEL